MAKSLILEFEIIGNKLYIINSRRNGTIIPIRTYNKCNLELPAGKGRKKPFQVCQGYIQWSSSDDKVFFSQIIQKAAENRPQHCTGIPCYPKFLSRKGNFTFPGTDHVAPRLPAWLPSQAINLSSPFIGLKQCSGSVRGATQKCIWYSFSFSGGLFQGHKIFFEKASPRTAYAI